MHMGGLVVSKYTHYNIILHAILSKKNLSTEAFLLPQCQPESPSLSNHSNYRLVSWKISHSIPKWYSYHRNACGFVSKNWSNRHGQRSPAIAHLSFHEAWIKIRKNSNYTQSQLLWPIHVIKINFYICFMSSLPAERIPINYTRLCTLPWSSDPFSAKNRFMYQWNNLLSVYFITIAFRVFTSYLAMIRNRRHKRRHKRGQEY